MNTLDLTVQFRSADGSSTEFYQADADQVRTSLQMLADPHLLTQPQILLASNEGATLISCRAIDMILARTAAHPSLDFPLSIPAGLLDIAETHEEYGPRASELEADPESRSPITSLLEIQTLGGWGVTLKVTVIARGNVYDERQMFAHLLEGPAIPFRLLEGGVGLINPSNIIRISAWPRPEALPGTALPLELLHWTPAVVACR